MSTVLTQSYRRMRDHFEPQDMDPQEQRRLRGHLEQIDYSAYVANREILGGALSPLSTDDFDKLASLTAQARALWLAESVRFARTSQTSGGSDQIATLKAARLAYEELAEAYEGFRRALERGYIRLETREAGQSPS